MYNSLRNFKVVSPLLIQNTAKMHAKSIHYSAPHSCCAQESFRQFSCHADRIESDDVADPRSYHCGSRGRRQPQPIGDVRHVVLLLVKY